MAEDRNEICVADRENGRVQCFTLDGDFTRSIQPEEFGSRIFSVAYTKAKGKFSTKTRNQFCILFVGFLKIFGIVHSTFKHFMLVVLNLNLSNSFGYFSENSEEAKVSSTVLQ